MPVDIYVSSIVAVVIEPMVVLANVVDNDTGSTSICDSANCTEVKLMYCVVYPYILNP